MDAFQFDASEWNDNDGDELGDNADPDDDNDGILDEDDAFPFTAIYVSDLDGDGLPDSIDPDIDGDGVANLDDAFPEDFTEWLDTDGDGIGNKLDMDDDGDGVIDKLDTKPLEYGQVPVYSEDKEISNSVSTNEGTITIDIQDIMILLAISSMLTLGFLWRAKRVQSEEKFEEKEVEL